MNAPPIPARTGAEATLETLLAGGVDVVFANPGTSEMHLVAALDRFPTVRGVLCLFEGVASGAADGYARMTGRPAATLLHLGPGFGNALANLHNARRAGSPVVNIVGEHAASHRLLDSPLDSDLAAITSTVSAWSVAVHEADLVPDTVAAAISAAAAGAAGRAVSGDGATGTSGAIATVRVAADASWSNTAVLPSAADLPVEPALEEETMDQLVDLVQRGADTMLLLGGRALGGRSLQAADRIRQVTGVRLLTAQAVTRRAMGRDLPIVHPQAYRGEVARQQYADVVDLVLLDALSPVTTFGYPGAEGDLVGAGTTVHVLSSETPWVTMLETVADAVAAGVVATRAGEAPQAPASGPLTAENWVEVVGEVLPGDAIVSDESITAGFGSVVERLSYAAPHDLLGLTGYATGQGIPLSIGAAVACPGRPVVGLQADGSAMFTISGLWTQAREGLDITTVILDNSAYAILLAELDRVKAGDAGPSARRLTSLAEPRLDFAAIAEGMGVPARRAETAEQLRDGLLWAFAEPGPHLLHAILVEQN